MLACLPARTSHRIVYALRVARQYAEAFNQPLSFDTSKVTTMVNMFEVRSASARVPNL